MVKTDMYNIVYSVGKKKSGPARQADATIVEFHLLQGFLICVATNKRTITPPQVKSWLGNSGLLVKAGLTHCATAATKCIVWIGGNVQVRDALNDIISQSQSTWYSCIRDKPNINGSIIRGTLLYSMGAVSQVHTTWMNNTDVYEACSVCVLIHYLPQFDFL